MPQIHSRNMAIKQDLGGRSLHRPESGLVWKGGNSWLEGHPTSEVGLTSTVEMLCCCCTGVLWSHRHGPLDQACCGATVKQNTSVWVENQNAFLLFSFMENVIPPPPPPRPRTCLFLGLIYWHNTERGWKKGDKVLSELAPGIREASGVL